MADIQPKLPETMCDPCEVPEPPDVYLKPTPRTVTKSTNCFPSMIKNMTAAKACLIWPKACTTE